LVEPHHSSPAQRRSRNRWWFLKKQGERVNLRVS
jgi:hypothetical protein